MKWVEFSTRFYEVRARDKNIIAKFALIDKLRHMKSQKINRLKVVLVENGKTGKWLAEQVGKNEATVSRWCSNKMQPSLDTLVRIAELLNVDPRQLINGGNKD